MEPGPTAGGAEPDGGEMRPEVYLLVLDRDGRRCRETGSGDAIEVHHMLANSVANRGRFPEFVDSPYNLAVLSYGPHRRFAWKWRLRPEQVEGILGTMGDAWEILVKYRGLDSKPLARPGTAEGERLVGVIEAVMYELVEEARLENKEHRERVLAGE